jgi:hypothetical protein
VQQVERKEQAFPPSEHYVGDSGRPIFNDLRLVAAVTALGNSALPSPTRFTDLDESLPGRNPAPTSMTQICSRLL